MSLAAIGPKPFDSSLKKVIQPGGWRECLGPNGTTFEQFVSRGASIDRSATIMLVDLNKQPLSEEQLQQLCTLLQGYAGIQFAVGALPQNLTRMLKKSSVGPDVAPAISRALGGTPHYYGSIVLTDMAAGVLWDNEARVGFVQLSDGCDVTSLFRAVVRRVMVCMGLETCGWFEDCFMQHESAPVHLCPVCLRKLISITKCNPYERYYGLLEMYRRVPGLAEETGWLLDRLQYTGAPPASSFPEVDLSMFGAAATAVRVEAQFSNGEWYPATITAQSQEAITVLFDDGFVLDLQPEQIRY